MPTDVTAEVLTGQDPLPDTCHVRAWRPGVTGISEVLHAHITDYAYPAHCHETWTVLIVDAGAIRYGLDTRHCGASGDTVALLAPGVVHDGQPALGAPGFTKRNPYLDASFLPNRLIGAAVDRTNPHDPGLRAALASLHDVLPGRRGAVGRRGPAAATTARRPPARGPESRTGRGTAGTLPASLGAQLHGHLWRQSARVRHGPAHRDRPRPAAVRTVGRASGDRGRLLRPGALHPPLPSTHVSHPGRYAASAAG